MNKKGQALVEFLIIIPLFVMLFLAVFDYARIMQTKFDMETRLEDVILNDQNFDDEMVLNINFEEGKKTYELSKEITIYSPVLSVFMGLNYEIKVERTIYE